MSRKLAASLAALSVTFGAFAVTLPVTAAFGTDTTTQAGQAQKVTLTGSANWGLKESFRTYINGPAHGTEEVSNGASKNADGTYSWTLADGQSFDSSHPTELRFLGRVHYTGHNGVLDVTVSNPVVRFTNATEGTLLLTVVSKEMRSGKLTDYGQVEFAKLTGLSLSEDAENIKLTASRVTLKQEATGAFSNFYQAGVEIDPITFALKKTVSAAPAPTAAPTATTPAPTAAPTSAAPTPAPTSTSAPAPTQQPTGAAPSAQPTAAPTSAAPTVAPTTEQSAGAVPKAPTQPSSSAPVCKVDETQTRVTSGNFFWGLRGSFTSYVESATAHGSITASGVSWSNRVFGFKAAGGLFNTAGASGTINYPGSIHFSGHDGKLNLTLSNPAIRFNGNSGTLYATVSSSGMDGKVVNYGTVPFASLSFAKMNVTKSSLNFETSSVSLTSVGAKAFAGFYSPGEKLDNLKGSASLTPNSECDPVTGELRVFDGYGRLKASYAGGKAQGLAYTGASVQSFALLATLAGLLGGAALVARRRFER